MADSLAPEHVLPLLSGRFGNTYRYAASTASTQRMLGPGDAEGTVAVADEQTEGRGRLGRSWHAPAGTALLFSTLLIPDVEPSHLPELSLVAGAAVAEAIADISGLEPEIKFPNDVLVSGRKVDVQPVPGRGTEYETKVRVMLAGGTVPDIMRTNDDYIRYYSIKDQILDLRPYLDKDKISPDDYYKPIWDFSKQPDGKYTGWALGNQPRVIFYNVNMFKDAGVPLPPKEFGAEGWRWDDLLDRAKKLTVPGQRWGALLYDDTGMEQTFVVNNGETVCVRVSHKPSENLVPARLLGHIREHVDEGNTEPTGAE